MTPIKPDDNFIWLYHTAIVKDLLGPGLRLVLWLSGCNFKCQGCIDPAQWEKESGKMVSISKLARICNYNLVKLDGITFSGGEPLLQAESLIALLKLLPNSTDKMIFTGYIQDEMSLLQLRVWQYMDISVEGRFVESKSGNFLWRGSENKIISSPSGKYGPSIINKWMRMPSAGISVVVSQKRVHFYGVPANGTLEKLSNELIKKGINIDEVGAKPQSNSEGYL